MTKVIREIVFFGVLLGLTGCVTDGLQPPSAAMPVCEAIVGPIKYNSKVRTSRRFAGPALAPDLAVRNRVGKNLRCPAYR